MIQIVIKAKHLLHNRDYLGAELTLPAGKGEILDALDRARVPYGSGEYQLLSHKESPGFVAKMLNSCACNLPDRLGPSIAEMNHLAERMGSLELDELDKLSGIVQIRGSYDIVDIINATHNLNRFGFYPGVTNDEMLGELAVDMDDALYEPLKSVPDELLDCFDRGKIGVLMRKEDRGVFTKIGYAIQESTEWDVVYDGNSLSERSVKLEPGDPVVSLYLRRCDMPDEDFMDGQEALRLHCPANNTDIAAVLEKMGVGSLDECFIQGASGLIPAFDHAFSFDADIEEINALAGAIKTHCGGERLAKYKAAYEMENVTDMQTALRLAVRLDEYDFEPHSSTEAFGRAALAKTGMDVKLSGEYGFDFDAYGYKMMQEKNIRFSPYGFISHPRGQELSTQIKRGISGLHMPETVRAIRDAYPPGTQVRLIRMEGEADMPRGLAGTVDHVDDAAGVHVRWENGSSLALLPDTDFFQTVPDQAAAQEIQPMEKPFEQTMGGM